MTAWDQMILKGVSGNSGPRKQGFIWGGQMALAITLVQVNLPGAVMTAWDQMILKGVSGNSGPRKQGFIWGGQMANGRQRGRGPREQESWNEHGEDAALSSRTEALPSPGRSSPLWLGAPHPASSFRSALMIFLRKEEGWATGCSL